MLYTIPADYAGADPIAGSVSVTATTADPDAGNNQAQTSTPLGADTADLSVSTYGAAQVAAGDQVTYEVVVTNHGPGLATAATLQASVPAELIFLGATAPCAAGFDCQLGDLAAGSSVVVAATYEVPAGYANADPVAFTVTVSAAAADPVAANDQSTSYTGVSAAAAAGRLQRTGDGAQHRDGEHPVLDRSGQQQRHRGRVDPDSAWLPDSGPGQER